MRSLLAHLIIFPLFSIECLQVIGIHHNSQIPFLSLQIIFMQGAPVHGHLKLTVLEGLWPVLEVDRGVGVRVNSRILEDSGRQREGTLGIRFSRMLPTITKIFPIFTLHSMSIDKNLIPINIVIVPEYIILIDHILVLIGVIQVDFGLQIWSHPRDLIEVVEAAIGRGKGQQVVGCGVVASRAVLQDGLLPMHWLRCFQ